MAAGTEVDRRRVPVSALVQRFVRDVLLQRRVWGRGLASSAHVLLFSGFVVLLIGTTLVAIEHVLADLLGREPTNPVFHKGVYFGVYELVTDTFGVALLVGCTMFLVSPVAGRGSFARTPADVGMLVLLIVIGADRLCRRGTADHSCRDAAAGVVARGVSHGGVAATAPVWTSIGRATSLCGLVVPCGSGAGLRRADALHATAAFAGRRDQPGDARPRTRRDVAVSMEEVEATGQIGVARLADFSRQQLLELDACVSCGRCEDACPAFEAGKPLSPRNVVQDLVGADRCERSRRRQCTARRLPPKRCGRARPAGRVPTSARSGSARCG